MSPVHNEKLQPATGSESVLPAASRSKAGTKIDSNGGSKSTAATGAWSSGRRLTEAQRQRKRAINNATRRHKRRARRLDRIAILELEIEKLKAGLDDPAEDVESNLLTSDGSAAEDGGQRNPNPTSANSNGHQGSGMELGVLDKTWLTDEFTAMIGGESSLVGNDPTASLDPSAWWMAQANSFTRPQHAVGLQPASGPDFSIDLPFLMRDEAGRDTTEALNATIMAALSADSSLVLLDTKLQESVLMHAVLYGWSAAMKCFSSICPLLAAIRYLDEFFLHGIGAIERLVIMYSSLRQIVHRRFANAHEEHRAWKWYWSRPSQLRVAHDPVVDHIVWPGMRERLVLADRSILGNGFWASFFRHFRFYWPSRLEDAFRPTESGTALMFSDELRHRLSDLSHWRFDMDFLNEYPEFACDVLPVESIPLTIQVWSQARDSEHVKECGVGSKKRLRVDDS